MLPVRVRANLSGDSGVANFVLVVLLDTSIQCSSAYPQLRYWYYAALLALHCSGLNSPSTLRRQAVKHKFKPQITQKVAQAGAREKAARMRRPF